MASQVVVGKIVGAFGVKGWVKVRSHTDPPGNILDYGPWLVAGQEISREYKVVAGRPHGASIVAQLEGLDSREEALKLKSSQILVSRDNFPPSGPEGYYWIDLIGLKVRNLEGVDFGVVKEMLSTGANDVVVAEAERERLIPFVMGQFIKEVDLDGGFMIVDWDTEF